MFPVMYKRADTNYSNRAIIALRNSLRLSAPLVAEGNNLVKEFRQFSGPQNLLNHQAPIPNYEKGFIRL
jgi:hypothetical protein